MAFPEIGLKARLDLTSWTRPVTKILSDAKKLDKMFKDLFGSIGAKGKGATDTLDDLARAMSKGYEALGLTDRQMGSLLESFGELGTLWNRMGAEGFNMEGFLQQVRDGKAPVDALKNSLNDAAGKVDILGFSVSKTALAVAGATAAFSLMFKIINQGIEDYEELATEVRLLRLEIGGTTAEASAWIRAAESAGVSTRSFETAVGMLQRKLVDTELRLAEGKEASTQFTRAMDTLKISATDAEGNLRGTTDLLGEIATKITALGPGPAATGLTQAIFGRGGRQMIPLLEEIAEGLERAKEETVKFGIAMSAQDEIMGNLARKTSVDLKNAWEGISILIGRSFTPIATGAKKALADLLVTVRQVAIGLGAAAAAYRVLISGGGLRRAGEAMDAEFERLAGLGDETSRALEEAKVTQDAFSNAAVINAQKLEALNKRLSETQQEINDLADTFRDRRADLVLQFGEPGEFGGRRWDDILIRRARELEDAQIAIDRRTRDLRNSRDQRMEDIYRRHNRRINDIEEEQQDKIQDFYKDAQRKREELEIDHRRRLRDIQQDYLDTVSEAARRNDAVGVVRAMRERAKETRDEKTRYKDEQQDLKRSLDEKLKQLEEENEKQKKALRDNLQDQLDDLEINYQRQLDAQKQALKDQKDDRDKAWRRQEEDFNRTKERQFADLNAWYNKERQALTDHMNTMIQENIALIQSGAPAIAQAAVQSMGIVFTAVATEMQRQQQWLMRHSYFGGQTTPAPPSTQGLTPREQWLRRHSYLRAEGGMDIVSGPTSFTFGEGGGAEAILSVPLRGQVTHSHQFSPLQVGFEGVPAGTNPQQMQNMMWSMMTELIKQAG